MNIDPLQDGITHINIYSKGRTDLGRLLTNFARTPFVHPDYGYFDSMEGFWYWAKTGKTHDSLRRLYGFFAKDVGKQLEVIENPDFHADIFSGIQAKLADNPELQSLLLSSGDLPLLHYYVYGDKVVVPKNQQWQSDEWMRLRKEYQKNS